MTSLYISTGSHFSLGFYIQLPSLCLGQLIKKFSFLRKLKLPSTYAFQCKGFRFLTNSLIWSRGRRNWSMGFLLMRESKQEKETTKIPPGHPPCHTFICVMPFSPHSPCCPACTLTCKNNRTFFHLPGF